MHCRLARLAEFGSGRARVSCSSREEDDDSTPITADSAAAPSSPNDETGLPFGQPVLVTCTAAGGQVSRFLCTAASSCSSQAADGLSIDPSVQLVPPSAASAASLAASSAAQQSQPQHQTPLDLARALDAGKPVSATVRPLQQKVVAATSLTARLLLPPSPSSPSPPPSAAATARARALWVAPALEQRLVQEGAILRPSPLCSASPACRVLSVEPRGPPGQLYRVVPSTVVSVLGGGADAQAESADALLVTTTGSGARLIDSDSAPKPEAAARTPPPPPLSAAGRRRSPAAAPAANQGRRTPQQPQQTQRPPARTTTTATAAAAAAPPRARATAAAANTKPRPKQQQRSPSPPSSPASPIATAPSPFGLLDGLGSDD